MPNQSLSSIPNVPDVGFGGAAGYIADQCTAFVANFFKGFGTILPAQMGNASQWLGSAKARGIPTSSSPSLGSIAVFDSGYPGSGGAGHVGVVSSINTDSGGIVRSFNILQGNAGGTKVPGSPGGSTWETQSTILAGNPHIEGFIKPGATIDGTTSGTSNSGTATGSGTATATQAAFGLPSASDIGSALQNFGVTFGLIVLGILIIGVGIFMTKPGQGAAKTGAKMAVA